MKINRRTLHEILVKYQKLMKSRRGDEVNDGTINYRRCLNFYGWFYPRNCPVDKTSKLRGATN